MDARKEGVEVAIPSSWSSRSLFLDGCSKSVRQPSQHDRHCERHSWVQESRGPAPSTGWAGGGAVPGGERMAHLGKASPLAGQQAQPVSCALITPGQRSIEGGLIIRRLRVEMLPGPTHFGRSVRPKRSEASHFPRSLHDRRNNLHPCRRCDRKASSIRRRRGLCRYRARERIAWWILSTGCAQVPQDRY